MDTMTPDCFTLWSVFVLSVIALFMGSALVDALRQHRQQRERAEQAVEEQRWLAGETKDDTAPPAANAATVQGINAWSAVYTGQQLPAPAIPPAVTPPASPAPPALRSAPTTPLTPERRLPVTHCPLCVVETCEEWGIPLDPTKVIGERRYCRDHSKQIKRMLQKEHTAS